MAYEALREHQPVITWREFAGFGATPGMQALDAGIGLIDDQITQLTQAAPPLLRALRSDAAEA
ncbi:hypothetical protein [Streptomyces sp. NPDC056479]|uniref:hypothetical protein n=1 Tax=unclassified Streptomyces TaxID=2593676 RepID=UPI0036B3CC2A